jgi:gliding motility-associated-like protein
MVSFLRDGIFFLALLFLVQGASSQNYTLNGDAASSSSSCITVTPNATWQNGSVWYNDLIDLSQPFTLEFQMNFGNVDANGADGMAFVMQTVGANAIGTDGAGFGFQGFNPSFGIEFDTYHNGDLGDLTADHVAFHRDGNIYHNLPNNLAGPVTANSAGQNIEDGQEHPVKIVWNPTTEVLELYFDCSFRLSASIDLVNSVFNGVNQVWWGFTGATGGLSNAHVVCLAETYVFEDNIVYTICEDGSTTISANGNPEGTFLWTPSAGLSNSAIQAPIASPTTNTQYCYTYTDVCGNVSTGCVQVNLEAPPAVSAGSDDVFCANDQYTLTGACDQADALFQWTTANGNFSGVSDAINAVIDAPGTYELTATSAVLGCTASDEVIITETPLPNPTINSPISKCTYDDAVLDIGNSWQSIVWADGTTSSTFTAEAPGSYDVVIEQNNCDATMTFVVNDIILPNVDLGLDQVICEGDTAWLDAATIVTWNTGTTGAILPATSTGEYIAEASLQGCFERDTVEVIVQAPPYVELGPDTAYCEGQTLMLRSQQVGTWNSGDVGDALVVTEPATYQIEVVQGPCTVIDSVAVAELPLPFVTLGADPLYCEGNSYELSAMAEFADYYTWSTGDTTETIRVEESVDLAIEVGNSCGTSVDSLFVVFEDCSAFLYFPSCFSPNGDGINDVYRPSALNIDSYDLKIFDKWGRLVFWSLDADEPWVGDSLEGEYYVPNGVYNYFLVCRTGKGNSLERRGHILVTR